LAVRGVDTEAKEFQDPRNCINIPASVLWITRLLALEISIPSEPWLELRLLWKVDIPSVQERIKEFRLAYLVEGSFCPRAKKMTLYTTHNLKKKNKVVLN